MKCLVYEMYYLLNALSIKCPIYEMSIYELDQGKTRQVTYCPKTLGSLREGKEVKNQICQANYI